jgi:ubiquitin C-terminal hydrolase
MATYTYFEEGIANKCFGILSTIAHRCYWGHLTETYGSHYFLNLHVPLYNDKRELDIEGMIDKLFTKYSQKTYCKGCNKKDVRGKSQMRLIALPKTLIIVIDRFTEKAGLTNLVSSFPDEIDLNKHVVKKKKSDSVYKLAGFISYDPLYVDYNVCLKNKAKEVKNNDHDWAIFNKRGMTKVTGEQMFAENTSHNTQILMYNLDASKVIMKEEE